MELKYAWELASERIIAPKYPKKEETNKTFDFVRIPEFEDKEDKAVNVGGDYSDGKKYADPTKLIEDPEEERSKIEKEQEKTNKIRVQEAETIHVEDIMECYWNGQFYDYGGFARLNRTMVFGLSNRNVRVKVEAETEACPVHVNKSTQAQLQILADNEVSEDAPKIYGVTVPLNYINHPGKKMIYTMIETSEKAHKDYMGKLNLCDEVWVASKYGKRVLEHSGLNVPSIVMPLGVDVERYAPDCGEMTFKSARGFKFLSVFRWSPRKGYDILLKAYLEEFSGQEDVSLILVSRAVECMEEEGVMKIVNDFNDIKSSIDKTEEEMPHVSLYTKPISERDMPKVYNSCNAFVLISRGEGFCTLPVAQIKTANGIKQIKNVSVGDVVFSHKGIQRRVTNIFEREYHGEMVKIKCYGRNNQYLHLTPNHTVRVLSTNNLSAMTRLKSLNNLSYNVENDEINVASNHHNNNKFDKLKLEWKEVGKIQKGDYLFYPRLNHGVGANEWVVNNTIFLEKIKDFKDHFILEGNCVFKKGRNQHGSTFKTQCLFDHNSIDVTHDFLKLMGYFVAEGCCSRNEVIFSFHKNETGYHKEVADLMRGVFGEISFKNTTHKLKNSTRIVFQSIVASRLFEFMFGKGARNKKLPEFMFFLNEQQQYAFLHGLFNGDGNYSKKEKTSLSTSSVDLVNNVFDILFDLKIKASIKNRIIEGKTYYTLQISNIRDCNKFLKEIGEERYSKTSKKQYDHYKQYSNFQLLPVFDVAMYRYDGMVYNIGVEIDNSYICENIAVHNCLPIIEAASCGLPIIASNVTAQTDYLSNDNSYLVEPEGYIEAKSNGNLSKMAKLCHFYEGQIFPDFGQESIDQTRQHMRQAFENYSEAKGKAEKLRSLVANNYTWDMAINKVHTRLKEIK